MNPETKLSRITQARKELAERQAHVDEVTEQLKQAKSQHATAHQRLLRDIDDNDPRLFEPDDQATKN